MGKENEKLNGSFKIKTSFVYTQKGLAKKESLPDTVEMRYLDLILRSVNKIMGKDNFCTRQGFYNERFGQKVSGLPESKRFVRIKSMKTKKSVYRIWNGISTDEGGLGVETKEILYIDKEAKRILTGDWKDDDDDQPVELEFKRVPGFLFYFFSGNAFNKITYAIAWISFALAIISLALAIPSFCAR